MRFKVEAEVKEIKKLHEQVRPQIKKVNEQYKFKANKIHTHLKSKSRDLAWLHLRKEIFPSMKKN